MKYNTRHLDGTKILLTVLCFFALYYPPIIGINTLHILAFFSYCYMVLCKEMRDLFFLVMRKSYSLLLIFVYLLLICVFKQHINEIIGSFVLIFEVLPICCMLVHLIHVKCQNTKVDDCIVVASLCQSIISLIAFFIPSFQRLIIQWYIDYGFRDVFLRISGWRMFGFSYTMTYAMPAVQGIIASYCLYKGINNNKKFFLFVPIILFSGIINARVAIIVFVIGALTVLGASLSIKRFIPVCFAILLILFIPTVFLNYLTNDATKSWIESGIQSIFSFFNNTEYSNDSYFLYLEDSYRYQLPSSFLSKFLGEGHIARGDYSYTTDIGFINDIWLGGLVYCIAIVLFYVKKTSSMIVYYCKTFRKTLWFLIGIITILILLNIKGRAFSWNELMILWSFVYCNYICEKYYLCKDLKRIST